MSLLKAGDRVRPSQPTNDAQRRWTHGPLQPMAEERSDIFEGLFAKLLRRVGR